MADSTYKNSMLSSQMIKSLSLFHKQSEVADLCNNVASSKKQEIGSRLEERQKNSTYNIQYFS